MRRKMYYTIHLRDDYWWQNKKVVPWDEINHSRDHRTFWNFDTIKIAWRTFQNCPVGTQMTRHSSHGKKGRTYYWIKK